MFEFTSIHSLFWKSTQNVKLSPGWAFGTTVVTTLTEEPALLVGEHSVPSVLYPYIRMGTPSIVTLSCIHESVTACIRKHGEIIWQSYALRIWPLFEVWMMTYSKINTATILFVLVKSYLHDVVVHHLVSTMPQQQGDLYTITQNRVSETSSREKLVKLITFACTSWI